MGKIPNSAKKVFQGDIFSVWQWPQTMYDGSVATFEALKRADNVEVLATSENKILLCKQSQPDNENFFYGLPGGRCDEGETALVSAKRELLEETGYSSEKWQQWQVFPFKGKIDSVKTVFVAKNCVKVSEQHLDAGEKIEFFWVSLEELIEKSLNDNFRGIDLRYELLKLKLDKAKYQEFEKMLFD
jgi:ADP-ribose pyrophosphatase YjhB (NUDIX family)